MGAGCTVGNAAQLMNVSGTINGTTETAAYTYDNYSRLVTSDQTSNGSSAQRRFAYDRWNNRTGVWNAISGGTQIQSVSNQTVSFPGTGSAPTNRITSVTTGTTLNYAYEANGNVTSDGVHSYGYDSENRLVSVDSGGTASYAYDHQNRRYKTTAGSIVTHYIWQGEKVIAEHNGSTGAILVNYIYAGSRMILSGPYYLLSDQLSVRLTLNSSAAVKGQQGHLPFGEDFAESGTQQQKQRFTSYERDNQSGTDYAVNRAYSFGVGRFQSADPFQPSGGASVPQSWNRYAYVTNAPSDFVDPLGLAKAEPLPGDTCGGNEAGSEAPVIIFDKAAWDIVSVPFDGDLSAEIPLSGRACESSPFAVSVYYRVLNPLGDIYVQSDVKMDKRGGFIINDAPQRHLNDDGTFRQDIRLTHNTGGRKVGFLTIKVTTLGERPPAGRTFGRSGSQL